MAADRPLPRLYLIAPPVLDRAGLDRLAAVLDAEAVACIRLDPLGGDADAVARAAEAGRDAAAARGVPVVITDHAGLVRPLGLDGLHLRDGRALGKLRRDWGDAPILGAWCGASRHDGLVAGEAGADYVAFGPAAPSPLGGAVAEASLFAWWDEMVEVPVVAEGALDVGTVERLAPVVDFFAVGPEIWSAAEPVTALRALTAPLR